MSSINPIKLAWLLRADQRRGLPAGGPIPAWFHMWWAIDGQREYADWSAVCGPPSPTLMHPLPDWPSYGAFGMTHAIKYLVDSRPDLRTLFDVQTEQGLWHAIAWMYTHGLREYRLIATIDEETLIALDDSPPFLQNAPGDHTPALTWLMFFVWRCSPELQTTFDLQESGVRSSYLQWFLFEGAANLELGTLIAPRWRAWMKDPIRLEGYPPIPVPRSGLLMWQRRPDLQAAFDVRTEAGMAGLGAWLNNAWRVERALKWVAPEIELPTENVKAQRPFGVNLIGFAFGELGIGEDVRMAAAACEAAGIPYAIVNIHPGDKLRQADQSLAGRVSRDAAGEQAPYAINVFCLTGFDTARVVLERGPALFSGRFNIGWWPWELPVWPRDWLVAFDLVDEIWAATEFTHKMYAKAAASASPTATPIVLMPLPVSVSRVKSMTREQLQLPEYRFLFLYVFDFNSYLERKNPFAALKAFKRAFHSDDHTVGLVLKNMNSAPENADWRRFVRECARDPRIVLMDRTMERGEVLGLIQACDAYLSLHRSEGFGRTLAEAMLFGKPVVGTGFSGNVDFLKEEHGGFPVAWTKSPVKAGGYPFITPEDHAWWAEPDVSAAAASMREVKREGKDAGKIKLIESFAIEKFSPIAIGRQIFDRLRTVALRDFSSTLSPTRLE